LRPMANVVNVAKRGKMMLTVAWSLATLCSIPQVRAPPTDQFLEGSYSAFSIL
jgi:hypothetical protein